MGYSGKPPDFGGAGVTVAWTFQLGQCVSHKDYSTPSLVLSRVKTSRGQEVYGLRSFAFEEPLQDGSRDRLTFGDVLVDVEPGSEPCQDCMLHKSGMCPSR